MNAAITLLMLIIASFMPFQALAEPSKPIANLMNTPASAFDVFLFRLKERGRCVPTTLDSIFYDPDPCLIGAEYSFEDNILTLHFAVTKRNELVKKVSGKDEKTKEEEITKILNSAAKSAGVKKIEPEEGIVIAMKKELGIDMTPFYSGWIQDTPIRHGWATNDFDADEFREEIIKRTKISLQVFFEKSIYTAVRSHHGEITITLFKIDE